MIRATLPAALAVAAAIAAPMAAHATDVIVRVSGIVGAVGTLRVAVCVPAEYPTRKCRYAVHVPAQQGDMTVTIPNVAPGRYAVIAHHDRRDTGVVDTNWLGIPREGVGVSRNATGRFGPPGFDDVAIDIAGDRVTVPIVLRQEPEP